MAEEPKNLQELLDRFCTAEVREDGRVSVAAILAEVGTRSFGPLLLFAGVILASPLSGIPGMPTIMGGFVFLISVQLLVARDHFWLPRWLLERSVARSKLERAVKWLRRPARVVDRVVRRRLTPLVRGPGAYVVAAICAVMALGVPLMEVVPFSATLAGVAITIYGLSLTGRDGLIAIIAFALTASVVALVLHELL